MSTESNGIAIIGIALRLPGADTVDQFWGNLTNGLECITVFSKEELRRAGVPDAVADDPSYVPAAAIPRDVSGFDLDLFGMNRSDAEVLDPQHRLFMECAWEALENAGVMAEDGDRRTGVFGACDMNTYLPAVIAPQLPVDAGPARAFQVEISNDKDFLATRTAYKLDLRGPALSVQTGCSSSLVAIHLACESLLSNACDTAIAGGSRVHVPLTEGHLHHEGGVAAAEPHCRAFDADASGTIRGSGAAVVVLKRTEDALADGDRIYATILGSAINNDGSAKVGFTAPSVSGQRDVIREALAVAGVAPSAVSYVEAHGTGTVLGDPIEIEALSDALELRRPNRMTCMISAVKPNVGHLGNAAGVVGLIKAALAIEREVIPGTPNFSSPNPEFHVNGSAIAFSARPTTWKRTATSRVAGVSSFGIGGTNCHVVLGEPPIVADDRPVANGPELLVLSAATPTALMTSARRLADSLDSTVERIDDTSHTLRHGRRALNFRWSTVVSSTADAVTQLRGIPVGREAEGSSVCFLLPGQGAELAGMGQFLRQRFETFDRDLASAAAILSEFDINLDEFLRTCIPPVDLPRTAVVQPALLAVGVATARLWMSWGVHPSAVIGHSIGEVAAAVVAGIMSFEDGLRVAALRGRALGALPAGGMVAVRASPSVVAPLLRDLSISAYNGPNATVVGGRLRSLVAFEADLHNRSIPFVRLDVNHAFHTEDAGSADEQLQQIFSQVALAQPQVPCFSNISGAALTDEEAQSPTYWSQQARMPVQLSSCLTSVGATLFIEMGPGETMTGAVRGHSGLAKSLPSLGRTPATEQARILATAGEAWCAGVGVDVSTMNRSNIDLRTVRLPTYPFERTPCWFGERSAASALPHPSGPGAAENLARPNGLGAAKNVEPLADSIEECVIATVSDVLGVPPHEVSVDLTFVEQGLESLSLLEISERIRARYGVRTSLAELLDSVTSVAALVRRISETSPNARIGREAMPVGADEPEAPVALGQDPEPPSPFASISRTMSKSSAMQSYLADFVPRFIERTKTSKQYNSVYRGSHADPRNSAGFRSAWKEITYPVVARRSKGAYLWDLDGNRYIDITMSFGVAMFGHSPSFVHRAVGDRLALGLSLGTQSDLAGPVAERLCRMVGFERAVFTNSGTEAVMTAVRLARAATRRDRIAIFRGSYHGGFDGVLARASGSVGSAPISLGVPRSMVQDVIVLDYGSDEALEWLERNGENLACVLAEPVQSRNPSLQPVQFLRDVRRITRDTGTLLVLDEMITGFRADQGGVNSLWGIDADVVAYGKVLGGGLPIGAVVGRAAVLDLIDGGGWRYGDSSVPERDLIFFAGTFCKHPLAMAAANAVLEHLEREGPELQRALTDKTKNLVDRIKAGLSPLGSPVTVAAFASQFRLTPNARENTGELYSKALVHRGVYAWEGRTSFLSTAHTQEDVDSIVDSVVEAATDLHSCQLLRSVSFTVAPDPDWFSLRDEQRLLWLGMEMREDATATYNEVLTIALRGYLRGDILRDAIRVVVSRHEALRTRVHPEGDRQTIADIAEVEVEEIAIGDGDRRWDRAAAAVAGLRARPFDLVQGPVVRAAWITLRNDEHAIVVVAPHLVVDGWSIAVLRRETVAAYDALAHGRRMPLDPAPSFRSFVAAEQSLATDVGSRSYWQKQLDKIDPQPMFRTSRLRTYERRRLSRNLDKVFAARIRQSCATLSITPYSLGLAAWFVAIASATGRRDVTVAGKFAGQPRQGTLGLVGYCLKVLPMRLNVPLDASVRGLAKAVDIGVREAQEHWSMPESEIIETYWSTRERGSAPFGGVTFEFERLERQSVPHGMQDAGVDLAGLDLTKWDASMVLVDIGDGMIADLTLSPVVITDNEGADLLASYVALLDDACRDPAPAIGTPTRTPTS
ncbi:type I polyketide synthase [Microlunatus speluncae]|uniref:type I polyketide synthase n=1 Tax=Microlunatus speluncae TaxID=2594267 RepID=UPI00126661D1|nr:type I polyketide synthase [Microlunatus speluncae]